MDRAFSKLFLSVCRQGYSTLGKTRSDVPEVLKNPWQFGRAKLPSYGASARYRFLTTLKMASGLKPRRVLDVAAGDCFLGACLQGPECEVVVNDIRDVSSSLENWVNGPNLKFIRGNILDLDVRDLGRFDLVMASEVLEHVAEGAPFLKKLSTFMADGAVMIVTTPNGEYFRSKLPTASQARDIDALKKRQFGPDSDDHLFLYTEDEIIKTFSEAGLRGVRVDFHSTPFLSGHAGFRFAPKFPYSDGLYWSLDRTAREMAGAMKRKICSQLIVTATMKSTP